MKLVEGKILTNFKEILTEARLGQLEGKTRSQTPKLASRADFVRTDYIGISKFGIFNFRTTSQTHAGNYWYQTLEIPDMAAKLMDEDITPQLMKQLIENEDIKVYCDCPAFLYWSFKYMAWTNDYGIEPEDRYPKRNNVRLKGALCKHLLSLTDLIKSGQLYEQMAKDAANWLKYQNGEAHGNFNKARLMGDAYRKKNRINYETADSYMNDFFASKAGINKFINKNNIKGSLEQEIDRTKRAFPNITLDEFLQDEFNETLSSLSDILGISEEGIQRYFKTLGLE